MKFNKLVKIILVLVAVISLQTATEAAPRNNMRPSDYPNFVSYDKAVETGKPIAINFYVDWCGYCKRFAPTLDSLRRQYKNQISFVTVNCDEPENKALARKFGVRGYPSFYLVNPETKETKKVPTNFLSQDQLPKVFEEFMKK